jgi:hypothetical protein
MNKIKVTHSKKLQAIIDKIPYSKITVIIKKLLHHYDIDYSATYELEDSLNGNDIKTYIRISKEPGNYYIAKIDIAVETKFSNKKKKIEQGHVWLEFKAKNLNEVLKLFQDYEKKLLLV